MRNLLIVVLLGAVGYLGYEKWLTPPASLPPPVEVAPVDEAVRPDVTFPIKMRVKAILEEWKRISVSTPEREKRAAGVKIVDELLQILEALHKQGLHDEESLREVMVKAALELRYDAQQANYLVNEVLGAHQVPTTGRR